MEPTEPQERHLASSTLHREDVLEGGHRAVWGSYFEAEKKAWGYACCRTTVRGQRCPLQPEEATAEGEEEDDDGSREASRQEWAERKLLDEAPEATSPAAVSPPTRDAFDSDGAFLSSFALYWFHEWMKGDAAHGRPDEKAVRQTREAVLPLLRQLKRREVPEDLLGQLANFADLAMQREYARANDVYVAITVGKALWHSHLDLGQQRAHWGGGCSLRTMQRQVVEKDHKNAGLFDTDPVVQRYVHALKRFVTFMQSVQPNEDPSKLGHIPAPAASPADASIPVVQGVRDSDGRGREPEFVEPQDLPAAMVRGTAFGTRADRSHPFAAIGSARGI